MFNHGIVGFLCDGGNPTIINMSQMYIILGSSSDLRDRYKTGSGLGASDRDEQYIIFPGYKVTIYRNADYNDDYSPSGSGGIDLDNTNGSNVKIFKLNSNTNKTSSLKAYYKGTLLDEIHDAVGDTTRFELKGGPT